MNTTTLISNNANIQSSKVEPLRTLCKERHEAIQKVKLALKQRAPEAYAVHVLYNLVRGLDPRRGFTTPKGRGVNAHRSFLLSANRVRHVAAALDVALQPDMSRALLDACRQACVDNATEAAAVGDKLGAKGAMQQAMDFTPHGPDSTVAAHGQDCSRRYVALRSRLVAQRVDDGWPDWLKTYGAPLLAAQQSSWTMGEYLRSHDIGKVTTLARDTQGRSHFTGHAAESERLWLRLTGQGTEAKLMGFDMALHTLDADAVLATVPKELLPSLLLATYAQLLSNAESVFGGPDSASSKMKFKAFNKRASRLCEALFAEGAPT